MALIQCSECRKAVSDKAESCPHCGNPLAARPDVISGRQVRTVEKTAKRFKAHIILSTLILLAGVVWAVGSCAESPRGEQNVSPGAILLCLVGFVWHAVTRFRAWWHHG